MRATKQRLGNRRLRKLLGMDEDEDLGELPIATCDGEWRRERNVGSVNSSWRFWLCDEPFACLLMDRAASFGTK